MFDDASSCARRPCRCSFLVDSFSTRAFSSVSKQSQVSLHTRHGSRFGTAAFGDSESSKAGAENEFILGMTLASDAPSEPEPSGGTFL